MTDNLLTQLANLRKLFSEATPNDPKIISDYAWTIVKVLLQHTPEIGSVTARQLLADCIKLPIERPSRLYSTLLAAAVKVANTYPDFRFATFMRMWNIHYFLPEDNQRQTTKDGKSFPSLIERSAKALGISILLHPQTATTPSPADVPSAPPVTTPSVPSATVPSASAEVQDFAPLLESQALTIHTMLVTRIKEAFGKDGRKYLFVTLTSADGIEIETVAHNLLPSPLHPLPQGKRHYVNIGQFYNCLLRQKSAPTPVASASPAPVPTASAVGNTSAHTLVASYLSPTQTPTALFPTAIGYIESIDTSHAHMHIYDSDSRHFVAHVQRFSREKAGDFVRFIPITPQASKFKTAIILATLPSSSEEVKAILREIRITNINKEKGYATWELTDTTHPITELLSPLQLSQGETSPSFTTGYLNLATPPAPSPAPIPDASASVIDVTQTFHALIYLKRGKDRQKRPHIARLFPQRQI